MAYQTLLAHFPFEEGMDDVLSVATALAEAHGAHLCGVHVVARIDLQLSYEIPLALGQEFHDRQRALAKRLGERFENGTRSGDFVAEWRIVDDPERTAVEALVELGNTADLVVMALAADTRQRGSRSELGARVLGGTGRAVLLVPPGRRQESVGERVFVAWDGQRAATRALFAALPVLVRADSVRLQRVNVPRRDGRHSLGTTEELADTLSRHGVAVEVFHSDARESEIGGELVGFAEDWGADLIVSGAQEQGALREFLLGSTTRHLLEHARAPLLMSS